MSNSMTLEPIKRQRPQVLNNDDICLVDCAHCKIVMVGEKTEELLRSGQAIMRRAAQVKYFHGHLIRYVGERRKGRPYCSECVAFLFQKKPT